MNDKILLVTVQGEDLAGRLIETNAWLFPRGCIIRSVGVSTKAPYTGGSKVVLQQADELTILRVKRGPESLVAELASGMNLTVVDVQ